MFLLHVSVSVDPGTAAAFEKTYREVFCAAIRQQEGFTETKLLRARPSDEKAYRLVIGFQSEDLQQKWVATNLHQQVWAEMEANIVKYSVDRFEVVGGVTASDDASK